MGGDKQVDSGYTSALIVEKELPTGDILLAVRPYKFNAYIIREQMKVCDSYKGKIEKNAHICLLSTPTLELPENTYGRYSKT